MHAGQMLLEIMIGLLPGTMTGIELAVKPGHLQDNTLQQAFGDGPLRDGIPKVITAYADLRVKTLGLFQYVHHARMSATHDQHILFPCNEQVLFMTEVISSVIGGQRLIGAGITLMGVRYREKLELLIDNSITIQQSDLRMMLQLSGQPHIYLEKKLFGVMLFKSFSLRVDTRRPVEGEESLQRASVVVVAVGENNGINARKVDAH